MAYIVFNSGQNTIIARDKALIIWDILQGKETPTEEQEEFCLKIKRIYLNWRHAPDDYIELNKHTVLPMHIGEDWQVNSSGVPTAPDGELALKFARKWGLWSGGITQLADKYINEMVEERRKIDRRKNRHN